MFGLRRHEEPRSNNRACDCDRAPCGRVACFQSASAKIVSSLPTDQIDAPDWQGQGSHRLFYSPGASVVVVRLNLLGSHTRLVSDKSGVRLWFGFTTARLAHPSCLPNFHIAMA
jgi:hypothetical protein